MEDIAAQRSRARAFTEHLVQVLNEVQEAGVLLSARVEVVDHVVRQIGGRWCLNLGTPGGQG
ncbi:hypothetical protein [Streptacidiphilus sp. PAMC 29251]